MPNEVNIYTPRYLAEVVRQAPPIHTYFRDTFFTNIKTFSTERVDIDLVKGDRRMAAFVHPRVGGQVLKANGFSTESYKPPLINPYDVTTADQHMTRLPGEDLYSGMTPAQRAARKLMDEYNRLNDATTRREEWMCVQAVVTGQIPIVGPGVNDRLRLHQQDQAGRHEAVGQDRCQAHRGPGRLDREGADRRLHQRGPRDHGQGRSARLHQRREGAEAPRQPPHRDRQRGA